jgi:hypothetical protein
MKTSLIKFKNTFHQVFSEMDTTSLVTIPIILMVICFVAASIVNVHPLDYILFLLSFFLLGLVGIPIIVRKEIPRFMAIIKIKGYTTGIGAVIYGILLLLLSWGLILLFLVSMLLKANSSH